jgi:chaperone modulatory protein CbpM
MSDSRIETVGPEELRTFTLVELVELSGLAQGELVQLVECGTLTPAGERIEQWIFDARCLIVARTARRLRDDFELDPHGLQLAVTLLNRMDELRAQIADLRARLPGTGPSR